MQQPWSATPPHSDECFSPAARVTAEDPSYTEAVWHMALKDAGRKATLKVNRVAEKFSFNNNEK